MCDELLLFAPPAAPPAAPHLLSGLAELSLQDGQTGLQLLGAVAELGVGPVHGGLTQPQGAHLLLQLLLPLLQQLPAVGNTDVQVIKGGGKGYDTDMTTGAESCVV